MSNLGQYIPDVRLYVGDLDTPYAFSDTTILTALVNGVQYLGKRWYDRYLIFSSGIVQSHTAGSYIVGIPGGTTTLPDTVLEGDIFRNPNSSFGNDPPPIIDQTDLAPILIAASYLLRRAKASSSTAGLSWSTPDLSYSNIQSAKTYLELMQWDVAAIDLFFKQRLGKMIAVGFAPQVEVFDGYYGVNVANWYNRLARDKQFNR